LLVRPFTRITPGLSNPNSHLPAGFRYPPFDQI
jgi:hypothetical protein